MPPALLNWSTASLAQLRCSDPTEAAGPVSTVSIPTLTGPLPPTALRAGAQPLAMRGEQHEQADDASELSHPGSSLLYATILKRGLPCLAGPGQWSSPLSREPIRPDMNPLKTGSKKPLPVAMQGQQGERLSRGATLLGRPSNKTSP